MTNYVGFRGFAKPAAIDAKAVQEKIDRSNVQDLYVYWTGGRYRARRQSGRSQSLATITEVKTPIALADVFKRAAKAHGELGYTPELVRSGLFLHAGAKPCVYYPLEKKPDGSYVIAKTVPHPETGPALKAGDTFIPAPTAPQIEAPVVTAPALSAPADQPSESEGKAGKKGKGKSRK
jgi:hypothetical protein